ncbi:MAG: CDP-diacylglycerol--glycerol-3-phosphate 3-phosphatidyltransferase [Sphaerochaetaceae bacterium]|nr:CDP-diacylglycerol--glycerol-3-phosphate 3-phosphatidyltransferase [Sphaerochaetaceae bacterium]
MNLPNKLTVTRLVLAPFFFLLFFLPELTGVNVALYVIVLVLIYGTMELTDLLDGQIARKHHLVTDLGKVLDPFSDVISHLTFFTCLLAVGIMPVWAFIFILWREFAQSFTRMLMMGKGKAMAANIFGKAKTCLYALSCICGFALRFLYVGGVSGKGVQLFAVVVTVLFALAAFSSVMSYLIYVKAIRDSKVLSEMTR